MPSTLKRKNSIRDSPEPEGDAPNKNRKIQHDKEEEDDEQLEYSQSDVDDDEDNDSAIERPYATQGPSTRVTDAINFDGMDVNLAGTIARVEVVNFMCHKYLKVDLGPKINFVIGHNGSGKSAILTAITLALGANASATNRGRNLSAFIKEGTSAANITIHLTNGGPQPYKPELFPGHIVIERRLNKEGPSPYKLKNASGRVVSQKKEDLVAVLDHFAILVNNPLTMLTQDMARKFLSDSTPEDKYKLFMHGTQLTQLRSDFETVRESIDTATVTLERKRESLPKLEVEAREAQRRFLDYQKVSEIEEELDNLSSELVWSQIITKEKEAERTKVEVDMAKRKMEEMEAVYEGHREQIEQVNKKIEKVNDEWDVFKSVPDPNAEEKAELTQKKIAKEIEQSDTKSELVDINKRIKERRAQKEKHEKLLKIETDKLEASSRLKRDEISEEISKIRQSVDDKVKKAKQFRVEQRELGEQIKEARDRLNRVHRDGSDMRQRKEEIRRAIDNSEAQRGDRMRAFGHNMPQVLEAIRRETRWRKRKPVGPLGATLELLHPQYSETLEVFFSKTLNAFVVECFEDKSLLYQILVRYKMNFNPIYVSEYDLFDYSSGEPDEQYLTVLRAIRFEDEWVKRQLIIANKIEKTLLMENRAEADEVMYSKPRNAHLCFTSGGHKVGGKSGMKTETLDAHRGPQRFRTDVDVQIRKLQEELDEIGKSYNGLEQQAQRLSNEISDLERQQRACRQNENRIDLEIKSLERKIEEKEDILKEDDPVDLNMYEENIKECTESIKSLALQFQSINNQRDATLTELKEILKQIKVIQDKEDARERMSDEYRTKINKLHDIKSKLHAKLDEYASQRHSLRSRYESRKSVYNEALSYAAQWIEECKDEYPDRMETERDPTTVNNEIKGLQAQAARMEEEMGQSMAEVKRIAGEKGNSYLEAKSVIEGMEKLNRSLRKMLEKRMEKWKSFRDYMSLSASQYFGYYLHLRGDEGSLRFNHTSKRLDLRVSTGDQFKKGSRQKDSRSLSGGEKSFSQISLLLSLWQSISSPIICLDEFDVFMDAVNRKQTMNMIMSAASDNSSQYILITPQDASNMVPGKHVTIHRLADPER